MKTRITAPAPASRSEAIDTSACSQTSYASLLTRFQAGDLIFGLKETRRQVLKVLTQQGFHHCFANALNDKTVTVVIQQQAIDQLPPFKQPHALFLRSRLAYLISPNGKPVFALKKKGDIRSIAYRRACKLLLVDDDESLTRHNHFFLAGIDWARVTSKTYTDAHAHTRIDDSVTASEIRAAYRYCKAYGNHPRISFYAANGELTQPPWQQPTLMPFFQAYDQLQEAKLRFEDADTEIDATVVSEITHDVPIDHGNKVEKIASSCEKEEKEMKETVIETEQNKQNTVAVETATEKSTTAQDKEIYANKDKKRENENGENSVDASAEEIITPKRRKY